MADSLVYIHHSIRCRPLSYASVARGVAAIEWAEHGASLYGVWRSQIGRPRDELTAITVRRATTAVDTAQLLGAIPDVHSIESEPLVATLRPSESTPPRRQGNYAFRWFELPAAHWPEFSALCEAAWPGFESAYDSQVIGLWRCQIDAPGRVRSLLLTRRPDLAMWERSKIPQGEAEGEVRRQLSRRYDLCDDTWVHTTTLLTAEDRADTARWT